MSQKWHAMAVESVLDVLDSRREGLNDEEAARRLEQQGRNELQEGESESWMRRLLRQFHDVLIYILLVAAGLTAYLGEWIDTGVILAVVVINAVIGFVQEGKAEEALEEIRNMLSPTATVIRDGHRKEIDAAELVVGDVVRLESGAQVPADVRLIEVSGFGVEEAILTGESEPVAKQVEGVEESAVIGDRLNLAFSGTMVVRGTARAVVVATGSDTEVGQIGEMVSEVEKLRTPLIQTIDRFGMRLSVIILLVAAALFAYGWFGRPGFYEVEELFMLVVSLAVASIPEGLPAIMTITLALGVRRMAGRNAIVRKLPAVETLGSVTVICSDKTGTLTKNEMEAQRVVSIGGEEKVEALEESGELARGIEQTVRGALLCNDAELIEDDQGGWSFEGEPTEGALVVLGARLGLNQEEENRRHKRRASIPFASERRYMATLHDDEEEGASIVVKGAPERMLELCERELSDGGTQALDADKWQSEADRLADDGFRVLAVAGRGASETKHSLEEADLREGEGLIFYGLLALIDPPRPEAIEAVKTAKEAGIKVKMITGDHGRTARSIGEQMGIGEGREAVVGQTLEAANDDEWIRYARDHDIFARTSPEHKLKIVEALQSQDQVVAMTGDGVNDAPALKRADVGVAMGIKGTEATKQAADMVLADDNFASIAHAIHEGRTIYDNLKKTILFLLPTNGAEALMVLAAVVLAMEHLPITPVQILWVNMVTAVTLALALAFEPPEPGLMKRLPRPSDEPIVGGYGIGRILVVAVLIGSMALGGFHWAYGQGATLAEAQTVGVNTLVAGQLFYLFSSRFLTEPAYRVESLLSNRVALGASAVLVVIQLLFTYTPVFHELFSSAPIGLAQWGWVISAGLLVFVVVEAEKGFHRWRQTGFGQTRKRSSSVGKVQ